MNETMPLVGRYFIPHSKGTLIADFSGTVPELWMETRWNAYRLLPRELRNDVQLCLPLGLDTNIEDLAKELEGIFYRTLDVVDGFKEGKRELLDYCLSYGIQAVELTGDCPALAYLSAANHYCQRRLKSYHPSFSQPGKKRTQILKGCEFLESKWVVKLFHKIPAEECCSSLFHDLREIVGSSDPQRLKTLRHLNRLNSLVVKILSDEKFSLLFHRSFLVKLSTTPADDSAVAIFWEIYAIKDELLQAISQGHKVPLIRCFDDLHRLHDDLIGWLEDQHYLIDVETIVFPDPPFKQKVISNNSGRNYGIFPITSGKALWSEGRRMHHCIAGFAKEIERENGKLYAYRAELLGEPAATLLIRKELSGWIVQEINGPCNKDVSRKVLAFVHRWLEKQNKSNLSLPNNRNQFDENPGRITDAIPSFEYTELMEGC